VSRHNSAREGTQLDTYVVARPKPDVILVCNDRDFFTQVVVRMEGRRGDVRCQSTCRNGSISIKVHRCGRSGTFAAIGRTSIRLIPGSYSTQKIRA
jgi:hypothetical protein